MIRQMFKFLPEGRAATALEVYELQGQDKVVLSTTCGQYRRSRKAVHAAYVRGYSSSGCSIILPEAWKKLHYTTL